MKVNHRIFEHSISFEKNEILTIESTVIFSNIVRDLYRFGESDISLFNNDWKELKQSEILIVTDILGYEVNSATILKQIHLEIESQLNEKPEIKTNIEKLADQITQIISYECVENDLDLIYDEITVLELIRALGVKIETDSDTILDKMIEIIQVHKYLRKKVLIFINSLSYLTTLEISSLFEFIELNNVSALFIEPRRVEDFSQYILDEDLFLIKFEK